MADLLRLGNLTLHSGERTWWLLDCDAFSEEDMDMLAFQIAERVSPFGLVEGVPQGGLCLAHALTPYITQGPVLIVDDVLTTGASMEQQRGGRLALGAVLFARGPCPDWVMALLTVTEDKGT